ncbi:MAG TPA: ATP-binding protein, partial [Luteimonas sp.]|nr:ATP-binding protein [Luteimonas sp.]
MPAPSPSPQLPLALRYPPDQRLETFAGNRALVAQLQDFAAGAGDARMLLLVGPPGSGKTHLALAACAEAEAAGRRAAYLPLATARGRLGTALEA